jgi:hypothetical protein
MCSPLSDITARRPARAAKLLLTATFRSGHGRPAVETTEAESGECEGHEDGSVGDAELDIKNNGRERERCFA